MEPEPQKNSAPRNWRLPLALGLGIGTALPVSRSVLANLEPSLGYCPALAFGALAAGAIGGLVALVVFYLIKPSGNGNV
jgi:hypothetical protein